VLDEELGVAPDQETTALYEQINSGVFDKQQSASLVYPTDWARPGVGRN
jgi:hypothetical protein